MNSYFLVLILCLAIPSVSAQVLVRGQGMHPASVISGDIGAPPSVPTGVVTTSNSSIFSTAAQSIPLTICLRMDTYSHNTHQYMGKRTVLTIKTNILNVMQMDLITNILQLNLNDVTVNKDHAICLDINEEQLKQIQNVLIPSLNNRQVTQPTWLFHYLPIARQLCHWAILLGIVFATVMLSVAAYGMVMSHRGSADKVISTVAGLMVLLMAYTIYCLLIANASHSQTGINTISGNLAQSVNLDPLH